ncbi:gamma-glutamylcyclotransferase [Archangium primigenium]|uniref:gamma-glutamylcyclotransferase n=1 Tax=[Archangium] primigenium TaxID=2792470 RepID=UPI00195D51E4|nr:gamma-glutamylcyclotransferase [Archangium primigenium]MBM7119238.1 gamma-glutamylcyclotransferase [Archangium primigenium]
MNDLLRSPGELAASLDKALAAAPHDAARTDSWLFVYGSMLEAPPFTPVERRLATLEGWTRRFCLADPKMRGTARHPGLSLGLVRGRSCRGIAYRLSARTVREELFRVWEREMTLPFYVPCWLETWTTEGGIPVLTFCTDPVGPLHEPTPEPGAMLQRLATCEGESGPNADYLEETVQQLAEAGIPDADLAQLAERVRAARAVLVPSGR